jgi:hypothetical protein
MNLHIGIGKKWTMKQSGATPAGKSCSFEEKEIGMNFFLIQKEPVL